MFSIRFAQLGLLLVALQACSPTESTVPAKQEVVDAPAKPIAPKPLVFGIRLSDPLRAPACPKATYNLKDLCFELSKPKRATQDRSVEGTIHFPYAEMPSWINAARMRVELVDGKVELVTIVTGGANVQADVLADLQRKFGKPLSARTVPMRNGLGLAFDAVEAEWQEAEWFVKFKGAVSGTDLGMIEVGTLVGTEAYRDRLQREVADGTRPVRRTL